jgi:putative two-component system hydrogenase maturation factor HypX/HoxX
VDRVLPAASRVDSTPIAQLAFELVTSANFDAQLADKQQRRHMDEAEKPLAAYRDEELARMWLNFYGFDPTYHVARYNFIDKIAKSRTPLMLARHRSVLRKGRSPEMRTDRSGVAWQRIIERKLLSNVTGNQR